MTDDPTVQLIEQLRDRALGRTARDMGLMPARDNAELWRHMGAAVENSAVDELPHPPGRLVAVKQLLLKAGGFSWSRQRTVNRAITGAIAEVIRESETLRSELAHERRRTAGALAALEARIDQRGELDALTVRVDHVHAAVESITARLHETNVENLDALVRTSIAQQAEQLQTAVADLQRDVAALEARLVHNGITNQGVARELGALARDINRLAAGRPHEIDAAPRVEQARRHDLEALYARFEDEFRSGSQSLRDEMKAYLPDLADIREGGLPVVDVGCGRGDWLHVLHDEGIAAVGVDSSGEAIDQARAAGLDAVEGDAIEHLRSLKPESVGAVTAFHIVEHLEAGAVIDLVDAALRALTPGGVLIIETPNPTNLVVGAAAFYRDPTHRRPMNPDYLGFLVRDRGFVGVETRYVHPRPEYDALGRMAPSERPDAGLWADVRWALHGPQDFAVVARRPPLAG